MININGSHGEGGGQIIRTALALSAITKKPFKITNIRANRKKPGLQEQHLQAVRAVKGLCDADVLGDEKNSANLIFHPKEISPKSINVDISTAGSTALVLQTLFLASFKNKLNIQIQGGATWNKFAPSVLYLQEVFCPMLRKFGIDYKIKIIRDGFYPQGQAIVEASLDFNENLNKIDLIRKGSLNFIKIISLASKQLQEKKVAERQLESCKSILLTKNIKINIKEIKYVDSFSTGTGILCFANFDNIIIGIDNLGERGKPAEQVGKECAEKFLKNYNSERCVDEHMLDMLLPYLALLKGKIKFDKMTKHAETNIEIIRKFLDVEFKIEDDIISLA